MADISTTLSFLERLGFADILLWLLTFAVVYGLLNQVKVPQSKAARGIISIVAAFFVLMSVPASILTVITKLSSSMLLVVLGILVLFVFVELGGVRHKETRKVKNEKTGKEEEVPVSVALFTRNKYVMAIALLIIAVLVFVGAGGLQLLGLQNIPSFNVMGIGIIVVILLAVLWMIKG